MYPDFKSIIIFSILYKRWFVGCYIKYNNIVKKKVKYKIGHSVVDQ